MKITMGCKSDKIYRNEWKFFIESSQTDLMISRLRNILCIDSNTGDKGKYTIRSLYFDDYHDLCARDTEAGVGERFKWRIRYYNNDSTHLKLERKVKTNQLCHKLSCGITEEEYSKIMSGDTYELAYGTNKNLLKLFCCEIATHAFRPKIIVEYERIPYVDVNTHIRITFDKKLRCSSETGCFLNGNYFTNQMFMDNREILEVKFDQVLPRWIRHTVYDCGLIQTSCSKYYLGRKRMEGAI